MSINFYKDKKQLHLHELSSFSLMIRDVKALSVISVIYHDSIVTAQSDAYNSMLQ